MGVLHASLPPKGTPLPASRDHHAHRQIVGSGPLEFDAPLASPFVTQRVAERSRVTDVQICLDDRRVEDGKAKIGEAVKAGI